MPLSNLLAVIEKVALLRSVNAIEALVFVVYEVVFPTPVNLPLRFVRYGMTTLDRHAQHTQNWSPLSTTIAPYGAL